MPPQCSLAKILLTSTAYGLQSGMLDGKIVSDGLGQNEHFFLIEVGEGGVFDDGFVEADVSISPKQTVRFPWASRLA